MSPRRQEDPEDFDPKPLRNNGPLGGLPWKAVLGWSFSSFLVLYLLGAVPGLPSPVLRNSDAGVKEILSQHEETSKAQLRLLKMICRGVWRQSSEAAEIQSQCDAVR